MEIFKNTPNVNFMALRKVALAWSVIAFLIAVGSLAFQGLNLSIEFTGGTVVQVEYPQPTDAAQVRQTLRQGGFADATVQHFGTQKDVLIHLRAREKSDNQTVKMAVGSLLPAGADILRVNIVGPQVGHSLAQKGILAIVVTLGLMMFYLWIRFEWRLAVGATVATLHDLVFVIGVFSLFQLPFDLTVLGAILAMMGYSVNDTVVIFDRIREDFRKRRKASANEIVNRAVNETLSRTIMTAGLTLVVIVAMLLVGGPVLHGFSLTLCIGIVVGTYSSIYIASGMALLLGVSKQGLMVKKKEDLVDDRP